MSHYDVIEQADSQKFCGLLKTLCQLSIFFGGLRVAARMIVGKDQTCGFFTKHRREDVLCRNETTMHRSERDLLLAEEVIALVEKKDTKSFLFKSIKVGKDSFVNKTRAVERGGGRRWPLLETLPQLKSGLHRQSTRAIKTGERGQFTKSRLFDGFERAKAVKKLTSLLQRTADTTTSRA
jgi:hypothetical protein